MNDERITVNYLTPHLLKLEAFGTITFVKTHSITVTKREMLGKKVKKLRKEGILPANIYGKDVASVSVQVPTKEFEKVFKETGSTGLIELTLGSEKRPVLIHNVQYDYVTNLPVHVDFYQVNLKEKIKAMVPVELVGEPKAVTEKLGLLMQVINEVEVEALPADLPEHLEINVTHLAAIDDNVTVVDIKKPQGADILTPTDEMIAKITELVSKEAEEQAAAEAAAAEAASTEAGGAAPAEGETQAAEVPAAEAPTPETPSTEEKK